MNGQTGRNPVIRCSLFISLKRTKTNLGTKKLWLAIPRIANHLALIDEDIVKQFIANIMACLFMVAIVFRI